MSNNNVPRSKWPMAKVVTTYPDDQGQVRSVTVITSCDSALKRLINKLVLPMESPAGIWLPVGYPRQGAKRLIEPNRNIIN